VAIEYASVQIVCKSARNLGTDKRGWKGTAMHRSLDVFKDALFWGIIRPLLPLEDRPYRAGQSPHWIKVKEPRAPRYEARDGFFLMLVYCAKNCETIVEAEIIDLGAGAGRIRCLECGGDGDWSRFAPDMMPPGMICLDCKGSGYQLVSI
jgi:hypothetical protein